MKPMEFLHRQFLILLLCTCYSFVGIAQNTYEDAPDDSSKINKFHDSKMPLLLPLTRHQIPLSTDLKSGLKHNTLMLLGQSSHLFPGSKYKSLLNVPTLFIHHQSKFHCTKYQGDTCAGVMIPKPENEFVIRSYYHPALILDNINSGTENIADGGKYHQSVDKKRNEKLVRGYQTSLVFRGKGKTAWQLTSDYDNSGQMNFSIRQAGGKAFPSSGTTERFIINRANKASLGLGEGNKIHDQNILYGNTSIKGYLCVKALDNKTGKSNAAIAFEASVEKTGKKNNQIGDGLRTWLRLKEPHHLEISDRRDGNQEVFWSFNKQGELKVQGDELHFLGAAIFINAANYKRKDTKLKNAIDLISSIQTYKKDIDSPSGQVTSYGYNKEDLQKSLPIAVKKDNSEQINYLALIPVITQALKELKLENEQLKNELDAIKTKLTKK